MTLLESGGNKHGISATPLMPQTKEKQYHDPPPGVDYSDNPSVFGKILKGALPAATLEETSNLLSFVDRSPRAPLHALVIPKRHVPTLYDLDQDDLPLLEEMEQMAIKLLETHQPDAYEQNDFILSFHLPPFNSVDHLHLHVLAPASQMGWLFRYGKYQAGTRWCASLEAVQHRLSRGEPAVPFRFWKSFWGH